MCQLLKSEILDALKESLRDLESLRMVSATDPELVLLKEHLQTTIEKLEDETSADYQYGLAASAAVGIVLWPKDGLSNMTLTPLCLRVEAQGGRAIEEYRIHDNDVQVRRMRSRSQDDCDWRQLTAEELTNHVYRNSTVAQWLERRLGWRQLLRACAGEQNLFHTENAEHTGLRHVA